MHKLDTFTDKHRAAQTRVRGLIWDYYASLKAYRLKPGPRRAAALRARFDRIFLRRTGFVTLDRLLKRLHANKAELLRLSGQQTQGGRAHGRPAARPLRQRAVPASLTGGGAKHFRPYCMTSP